MPRRRRLTIVLVGLILLVFMLSLPGSLRDISDRGGFYIFSPAFLHDIPKRLTGPGRFRFVLQPLVAIVLGILGGLADVRAGRPPYLHALILHRDQRRELAKSGVETVLNLLLMGILLDAIFQWVILGTSHPGAAIVVGPVLTVAPYGVARSLTNRLAR